MLFALSILLTTHAFTLGASNAFASGEIVSTRAPEEIPEGDNCAFIITATAREDNVNRVIAVEYPQNWKMVRAYAVEAGSDVETGLAPFGEITKSFDRESGQSVIALADTNGDFNSGAAGVAYFVVFATKASSSTSATLKAALVERIDPDSPPEIDRKTKKPKPRDTKWHMTFPAIADFSFSGVTGKRIVQSVRMVKGWRTSRALVLDGKVSAFASLKVPTEPFSSFFSKPFSVECWFQTTYPHQPILVLERGQAVLVVQDNALGQIELVARSGSKSKILAATHPTLSDGLWHHLALSLDKNLTLRIFGDGVLIASTEVESTLFQHITGLHIGADSSDISFAIDELRLIQKPYTQLNDFATLLTQSARDTLGDAFALFHFDEYGTSARSTVPLFMMEGEKRISLPLLFKLDTNAVLAETSSPVQPDRVLLNIDLASPTKVSIAWKATGELGVKQYILERRIGSYGKFEQVLKADAKHGSKAPKRGQPIVFRTLYNAMETLPALRGDIELYYRIGVADFNGGISYSEPLKLEYGANRDVFVEQNQPNPFNPTTTIAFRLTKPEYVTLAIYDIIGRQVALLANSKMDPGRHTYELDATNWPGGIYFYKVKTNQTTVTRKMVLAK